MFWLAPESRSRSPKEPAGSTVPQHQSAAPRKKGKLGDVRAEPHLGPFGPSLELEAMGACLREHLSAREGGRGRVRGKGTVCVPIPSSSFWNALSTSHPRVCLPFLPLLRPLLGAALRARLCLELTLFYSLKDNFSDSQPLWPGGGEPPALSCTHRHSSGHLGLELFLPLKNCRIFSKTHHLSCPQFPRQ